MPSEPVAGIASEEGQMRLGFKRRPTFTPPTHTCGRQHRGLDRRCPCAFPLYDSGVRARERGCEHPPQAVVGGGRSDQRRPTGCCVHFLFRFSGTEHPRVSPKH